MVHGDSLVLSQPEVRTKIPPKKKKKDVRNTMKQNEELETI